MLYNGTKKLQLSKKAGVYGQTVRKVKEFSVKVLKNGSVKPKTSSLMV